MRLALLVLLMFACTSPPKSYTTPELGMPYYVAFTNLCGIDPNDSKTVTTGPGETRTVIHEANDPIDRPRKPECVGTFTFVNDKLTSIER